MFLLINTYLISLFLFQIMERAFIKNREIIKIKIPKLFKYYFKTRMTLIKIDRMWKTILVSLKK